MMPLYMPSNRIIAFAAVSAVSVLLSGLFLYQVHAQPLTAQSGGGVPAGTADLSAQAAGTGSSPVATGSAPMVEMHIANNGLVLLRGARVVSISGGTVHVEMAFGGADFTWALSTNSNTQFFSSQGGKEAFTDVREGDIVTATGMLAGGGTEPVVDTQFVRE